MDKINKIDKDSGTFEILFRDNGKWSPHDYQMKDMIIELLNKQNEIIERLNSSVDSSTEKDELKNDLDFNKDELRESEMMSEFINIAPLNAYSFVSAKFGIDDVKEIERINVDRESDGGFTSYSLVDLLIEYMKFSIAENIKVQTNPRTKEIIYIDTDRATIIGSFEKDVVEVKK